MIQTIRGAGKIPTTVYHVLPKSIIPKAPLLVFIPGNPGIINYYIPYFEKLSCQFGNLEILGISHAGHSINVPETFDAVFSLQDQIDHKVATIEEFLQKSEEGYDRHVLIMGHSVGSWMMERIILKMCDKVNFKFIGFITPTIIDIHRSEKGRVLYPLVKLIPIFNQLVAKFSLLLKVLPNRVIDFSINTILSNPPSHAFESTKAFISNSEYLRQSLGLATEEMHKIQGDWQYFEHFLQATEKIHKWFFFNNVDHWVDDRTQHEIMERLENAENCSIESNDELSHSFCVRQSDEFAEFTTKVLNELYYKEFNVDD